MTADRTPAQRRRYLAAAGAAGLLLGTAACSSSAEPAGGGTLSYAHVRSTAEGLAKSGPCPFGLDLAAALKDAGIDRPAAPGAADRPAVDTDLGDGAPAQPWPSGITAPPSMASVPATPPKAWVTCTYTVGSTPVRVDLLAVPEDGAAVAMMLPHIQRFGNLGVDQIHQFWSDRPKPGETRLTPGAGLAGVARVAAKGKGDITLTLSQDADDAQRLSDLAGEPLRRATERLAAQLHP
ncbi:hypothetical protein [Kitasatospora sp. A2-31]|uniref:hypothetical protein n=1 Tax=Kitasatospora sp. A2-31 TaxID=2916414 RepID=UPI001EE9DAE8|nr:hypothetical protein [Kitasatospora sp. A2-31]MCG6494588.1 hypothetical protein [Kitasatospora sp. A2-31]